MHALRFRFVLGILLLAVSAGPAYGSRLDELLKLARQPLGCGVNLTLSPTERAELALSARLARLGDRYAAIENLFGEFAPHVGFQTPYTKLDRLPFRWVAIQSEKPSVGIIGRIISYDSKEKRYSYLLRGEISARVIYLSNIAAAYPLGEKPLPLVSEEETRRISVATVMGIEGLEFLSEGEIYTFHYKQGLDKGWHRAKVIRAGLERVWIEIVDSSVPAFNRPTGEDQIRVELEHQYITCVEQPTR